MRDMIPKTTVVTLDKDGSEVAKQLIRKGRADYVYDFGSGATAPDIKRMEQSELVFILGTQSDRQDIRGTLTPALSYLAGNKLIIAITNSLSDKTFDGYVQPDISIWNLSRALDAHFNIYMPPSIFDASNGQARISALTNTCITILDIMNASDNIAIVYDEFKDALTNAGQAWVSTGCGSGKHRAIEAARTALIEPFSIHSLASAKNVILRIIGGNLLLGEANDIVQYVETTLGTDTKIIFSVAANSYPEPLIRVSLLATNINSVPCPIDNLKRYQPYSVTNSNGSKLFNRQEILLVKDWAERWLKFIDLINEVTDTHDTGQIIPPPTIQEEIEHMVLRSWFVRHQDEFVPLWLSYRESEGYPNHAEEDKSELDPDISRYANNPFLYFYEPQDFRALAVHLDLQTNASDWEPSEEMMSVVRPFMVETGRTIVEFRDWVDDLSGDDYSVD